MVQLLQQEDAAALPHNETAPLLVKGDGGPVGVSVLAQGLHRGKAAYGQGGDGRLCAAAEHDLGVAVPDIVEGVAHSVGAARAGGDGAGAHPPEAGSDSYLAGGHVADAGGNVEGGHAVPPPLQPAAVLRLGDGQPADTAGHTDAAAVRVGGGDIKASIGQRLLGRHGGKLGKAAHPFGVRLSQQLLRGEALDLGGQLHLQLRGVELCDGGDAAHALPDRLPAVGTGKAQGGNGPHSSDDYSTSFHVISPSHMDMPPSTARTWPVI